MPEVNKTPANFEIIRDLLSKGRNQSAFARALCSRQAQETLDDALDNPRLKPLYLNDVAYLIAFACAVYGAKQGNGLVKVKSSLASTYGISPNEIEALDFTHSPQRYLELAVDKHISDHPYRRIEGQQEAMRQYAESKGYDWNNPKERNQAGFEWTKTDRAASFSEEFKAKIKDELMQGDVIYHRLIKNQFEHPRRNLSRCVNE